MLRGFTVIELIIVIAIAILLASAAAPVYSSLQIKSQLIETKAQLVQDLRLARENSISRSGNSAHGVFLNLSILPNTYTVYQGPSYSSRIVPSDRLIALDDVVLVKNVDLNLIEGNIDINFSGGLGRPNNIGSFNLVHSVSGTSTININSLGKIE